MMEQQLSLPLALPAPCKTGKCGRCGRRLSDPKSVERGYGPVCAAILGISYQKEKQVNYEIDEGIDNPVTRVFHDAEFNYPSNWNGSSSCDLQIFNVNGRTIVIASELITRDGDYAQDGTSVTNAIEHIAYLVKNVLGYTFDTLIEFYPVRGSGLRQKARGLHVDPMFDESFSIVTFKKQDARRFGSPEWEFIKREDVEQMIGQSFYYHYR